MCRRAALLKCEEAFELSDRYGYESKPIASVTGFIEYKDSPEWQRGYTELKSVLDNRENLPNKEERRAIRQAKAKGAI